jgi:hypothetical protein
MGAESVLVGLSPGIVSALIEAGADVDGLRAAINLDAAFVLLQPEPEPDPTPEPDTQNEAGAEPGSSSEADCSIEPGPILVER